MAKHQDLTGMKFGRLFVLREFSNPKPGNYIWECQCECGNITRVNGKLLRNGTTSSCGCIQRERTKQANTKHGKRYSNLYGRWCNIKSRCLNPHNPSFRFYGERGISICEEWLNFDNFYNWAIDNGFKQNLTIDRINTNGNYEPFNCRWVNMEQQNNNRRSNHILEYKGEKHTLTEWAKIIGVDFHLLSDRCKRKDLTTEQILFTPVGKL